MPPPLPHARDIIMAPHNQAASSSVRKRLTPFITVVGVLTAAWAADTLSAAEPDGGVQLSEGSYLFAEHADEFTDATDGITIEAWVWMTETPGDNAVWPLVVKPGSYSISLRGRNLSPITLDQILDRPPGWMHLDFSRIEPDADGTCDGGVAGVSGVGGRRSFPVDSWIHVAFEVQGGPGHGAGEVYVDGWRPFAGEGSDGVGRLFAPLLIGGRDPDPHASSADWCSDPWLPPGHIAASLVGWLDEVRISKGWRYSGLPIQPMRRQIADADTIALWTFADEPTEGRYEDVSGNGHSLFVAGSVATSVSNSRHVVTTWAQLKRQ